MFEKPARSALTCILLGVLALVGALGQNRPALKIAAAADLQPVLPPLIADFQKQTGMRVEAEYASSATLATQIVNGGPFDLFLAADMSFPQRVIAAGLADSANPQPYARGTLVLWARNDSPIWKLKCGLSVETLKNPAMRKIAVADATHAPYGRAAMAAIRNLDLTEALQSKLVIAENIAQTAQFVESGNAEAGFISLTSALTPRLQAEGKFVEIPASKYPPILQGAVVMKNSPSRDSAHRFLDFLSSPRIQKELAERGLKAP